MNALPKRMQNRLEREARILDAALRLFGQHGYSATSMDDVAHAAGLTKPTIYQYFPSKEQLFTAMLARPRDEMLGDFLRPQPGGMVAELHAFAWHYASIVLQPDLLAIARLIIGEAQRLPEIGRAYQASGPDRVLAGMIGYLDRQRSEGRLSFDDGELAAEDLWGLILSAPRNRALHIPDAMPDSTVLARYINNGLRVFLRAYSTNPKADLERLACLTSSDAVKTELS